VLCRIRGRSDEVLDAISEIELAAQQERQLERFREGDDWSSEAAYTLR
jgi:hypothetical protein